MENFLRGFLKQAELTMETTPILADMERPPMFRYSGSASVPEEKPDKAVPPPAYLGVPEAEIGSGLRVSN